MQQNIPLSPLTTLGVGGAARYYAEAKTADDVRQAAAAAGANHWPLLVMGGGSNLVIADAGWSGLVLRVAISGVESRRENGNVIFTAGAGESWDALVAATVAQNCAGLECLSGIPGTVGGTPVQNVGAYGQEVSDTIREVQALDLLTGEMVQISGDACRFDYRKSIFNTIDAGRFIIVRVSFALRPGAAAKIEYADLKKAFAGRSTPPTLQETRDAVRQIRHTKAMLIVPGDEDARSAGSFFKNPLIDEPEYERLCALAAARGLQVPRFTTTQGVKVPAAWLVEQSGMSKGFQKGAVGISRRHALAIVNRGGATAAEVMALKNEIQQRVFETFGIKLATEPVFAGFDTN
jgi:UDP-N-acetylmuramate dehydrogenase